MYVLCVIVIYDGDAFSWLNRAGRWYMPAVGAMLNKYKRHATRPRHPLFWHNAKQVRINVKSRVGVKETTPKLSPRRGTALNDANKIANKRHCLNEKEGKKKRDEEKYFRYRIMHLLCKRIMPGFSLLSVRSRQQFPTGKRPDRRLPDRLLQRELRQDLRLQSRRGTSTLFNTTNTWFLSFPTTFSAPLSTSSRKRFCRELYFCTQQIRITQSRIMRAFDTYFSHNTVY